MQYTSNDRLISVFISIPYTAIQIIDGNHTCKCYNIIHQVPIVKNVVPE